jgi:hypothetical protein
MKKYMTSFTVYINVRTVIESESISDLRHKIREELKDVNSHFTLPPSLNKNPEKLKIKKPTIKNHYPSDDDLQFEKEHEMIEEQQYCKENSLLENSLKIVS